MPGSIDILNPEKPKRVVIIASNPAVSKQTGWPIGFWWAELTHSYWELTERGYHVDIASPLGGKLEGDSWSDPRDKSGYSAHDLISLGFIASAEHRRLIEDSKPLRTIGVADYDAVLLVGGQGPMYTFFTDEGVHKVVSDFYEAGKPTAVICHATSVLLQTKLSTGRLLVEGKTWTGFANSEEQYADEFVGRRIQPFWIEEEAKKIPNTNFIVNSRFKSHAVRDGNLITGQQQYSGAAAARLMIEALGCEDAEREARVAANEAGQTHAISEESNPAGAAYRTPRTRVPRWPRGTSSSGFHGSAYLLLCRPDWTYEHKWDGPGNRSTDAKAGGDL